MTFKEIRMILITNAESGKSPRRFLMEADKAEGVRHSIDQYNLTGYPEDCVIDYEDSGEEGHMSGLAGQTRVSCESIADIQISFDPLGP
jgi:hypothetical protein